MTQQCLGRLPPAGSKCPRALRAPSTSIPLLSMVYSLVCPLLSTPPYLRTRSAPSLWHKACSSYPGFQIATGTSASTLLSSYSPRTILVLYSYSPRTLHYSPRTLRVLSSDSTLLSSYILYSYSPRTLQYSPRTLLVLPSYSTVLSSYSPRTLLVLYITLLVLSSYSPQILHYSPRILYSYSPRTRIQYSPRTIYTRTPLVLYSTLLVLYSYSPHILYIIYSPRPRTLLVLSSTPAFYNLPPTPPASWALI